jgi:hypothetical protein
VLSSLAPVFITSAGGRPLLPPALHMLSTLRPSTLLAVLFVCVSFSMIYMGLPQVGSTTLFEDNMTCITMSESTASTPRMQHLDARYHWLREQVVTDKSIRLVYVLTLDQVADCLTKPLPGPDI